MLLAMSPILKKQYFYQDSYAFGTLRGPHLTKCPWVCSGFVNDQFCTEIGLKVYSTQVQGSYKVELNGHDKESSMDWVRINDSPFCTSIWSDLYRFLLIAKGLRRKTIWVTIQKYY